MSEELEKKLGYRFKNRDLLTLALTHKSVLEGSRKSDAHNEKLEFLGDAVIGLVITDFLFRRSRHGQEGDLTKMKLYLVSSDFLFRVSQKVSLSEYVLLGRGAEKTAGRRNKRLVSSTLEALLGAIYLDGGFKAVALVIHDLYNDFLEQLLEREARINDYKSELQEVIQKHRSVLPQYRVLQESGKPPDVEFRVAVFLDGVEIGSGRGHSRREAEQNAAQAALHHIGDFIGYEKLSEVFFIKNDQTNSK
jgi:ribonuclease III